MSSSWVEGLESSAPVCYSAAPFAAHAERSLSPDTNLMANTKQARHRARQSTVRNAHNSAQRSRLRTAIKSVRKAIEGGDKKVALDTLNQATSVIDSIADKKVVHKNTASRNKSRLAAAVKSMA